MLLNILPQMMVDDWNSTVKDLADRALPGQ